MGCIHEKQLGDERQSNRKRSQLQRAMAGRLKNVNPMVYLQDKQTSGDGRQSNRKHSPLN